jgi:transposase
MDAMSWQDNLNFDNCKFHCPHLGGEALSSRLVACDSARHEAGKYRDEVDRLSKELAKSNRRVKELSSENEQLRRELKAIHRRPFQKHARKKDALEEEGGNEQTPPIMQVDPAKKRGAPIGHPGWHRPMPTHRDRSEDVIPKACPDCGGSVTIDWNGPVNEHVQEDLADGGGVEVVCFRHPPAWCAQCGRDVEVAGAGELLGCPIGPKAKAAALLLQMDIGLSCRKVQRVLERLLRFKFSPSALIGFGEQGRRRAQPLADDIVAKLHYAAAVYADESYWTIDAAASYVWFHGNEDLAYFQIDTSRAGRVSREILGEKFDGGLVTDCYSGYAKHATKLKQKCLAHLRRAAKEWTELVPARSQAVGFFHAVVEWVRRACDLARGRPRQNKWSPEQQNEIRWLRTELNRLESMPVDHERAERLQKRLQNYHDQWLTFIDHPELQPTNNLAERALRPLVVLRKLTFGNRSAEGARRTGVLISVVETAKRQGHDLLQFLQQLFQERTQHMIKLLYQPSG